MVEKRVERKKVLRVDLPEEVLLACEQTAKRMSLTPAQYGEYAIKRHLESIGVVWWKTTLEINTPGDIL